MGKLWIVRLVLHTLFLVMSLANAMGSIAALTAIDEKAKAVPIVSLIIGLVTVFILLGLLLATRLKKLTLKLEAMFILVLYVLTLVMLIFRVARTTFLPFSKNTGSSKMVAATVLMLLQVVFSFIDLAGMACLFLLVTVKDKVDGGWQASIWDALNGGDVPLQEPEDTEQEA